MTMSSCMRPCWVHSTPCSIPGLAMRDSVSSSPWLKTEEASSRSSRRCRVFRMSSEEVPDIPDALPDYARLWSAAGDPDCVQCVGVGHIECPVCQGKGFYTMEIFSTVSSDTCRMCMGRKKIPCPTCKQMLYKSVIWWDVRQKAISMVPSMARSLTHLSSLLFVFSILGGLSGRF